MTVGRLQIPECVPHNNKRKAGITNAGNVPEHQRKRKALLKADGMEMEELRR